MLHIRNKNIIQIQRKLSHYFAQFGIPREIITDYETTFRSTQLRNYLASLGVALKYASCSESNGQIEKTHCTITDIYKTNKHKYEGYDTQAMIKIVVELYNVMFIHL